MRGKQASKEAGACHHPRSRLVIPSRHPCGRACCSRSIVPSSPHPIIPGKQAGRRRQDGIVAWASVSFSRFCPGAVMIPGRASCSRHPHGGLPSVPRLIPIPISKRQDGKQANGKGRTVSAIVSRRTTEDKQARRERRTTPPHPYHHTTNDNPTGSITCPINTSPRLTTSTNETQDETPETMKRNEGEHRNDGRTTERKRTTPQDDKQTRDARTRRRTRRTTTRRKRDETQAARAKVSKQGRREHEKREEQTDPSSNLSARPPPAGSL